MLNGIKNFLELVNENWTLIAVCLGLLVGIYQKFKAWQAQSDEEKIEHALSMIRETMLKFVTKAEEDYTAWFQAGSIKRAQVIDALYQQYPILSKAIDQEALVKKIDEAIDAALPELRKIIKETNKQKVEPPVEVTAQTAADAATAAGVSGT